MSSHTHRCWRLGADVAFRRTGLGPQRAPNAVPRHGNVATDYGFSRGVTRGGPWSPGPFSRSLRATPRLSLNKNAVTWRPSPAPRVRVSLPLWRHLSVLAVLTSTPAPSPSGVQTLFPPPSSALRAVNRHLATYLLTVLRSVKKCYLPVLTRLRLEVSKTEPLTSPALRPLWP